MDGERGIGEGQDGLGRVDEVEDAAFLVGGQRLAQDDVDHVAGAGHGPGMEQADHVNASITAFITAASKNQAR
jgi:hypothetical protein